MIEGLGHGRAVAVPHQSPYLYGASRHRVLLWHEQLMPQLHAVCCQRANQFVRPQMPPLHSRRHPAEDIMSRAVEHTTARTIDQSTSHHIVWDVCTGSEPATGSNRRLNSFHCDGSTHTRPCLPSSRSSGSNLRTRPNCVHPVVVLVRVF
jgi:hypothetical protein